MNRGVVSNFLRTIGFLRLFDWLHYRWEKIRFRQANRDFREENPDVKLPPDYLLYESYQLNYKKYYTDGLDSAGWLTDHLSKHIKLVNLKILDWGCGPGRIIRHLPEVAGLGCSFYCADYNAQTIEWCKNNLPGISFVKNGLKAKLPFDSAFFDVIYGISVFTHLSEEKHHDWTTELFRILKPGGILFITTQGENFIVKLTESEKAVFGSGNLVERAKVKEGHRTFSAFQPATFMRRLFAGAEILEHIEEKPAPGRGIPQDIWIIKKPV